ncbi:CD151 antigen-like [Episyrphus balteatus]|uniref:CD151 antigen-like n=1 Tax=Episyrphus balteatus TaxID=286459 RepID=UPI0024866278|nr:CD151 antigen-like [Episyrphus balteatus]XP_055854004.1 CD151 antigen-like [Episyrphus balteatus]XP_055854005.1 CD151 antigen-like [Episyrphus balteatus]
MSHYSTTKRKRHNHCCGSISLIKCMLHIFNIVFLMSGVVVYGVAMWTIFWKLHYAPLLVSIAYQVGTYGLAVAGALAIIGGFLGCFGIFYEQKVIILFYTFLLVLVFLLELIIGGLAYFYETQLEDELKRTLNKTFASSYGIDESRTVAIDRMQQEYKCCGAIRFEDWRSSEWLSSNRTDIIRPTNGRVVPDSCCVTLMDNCGLRDHPSNIPYTGCIYQFSDEMRRHLIILGAVGLGICLIHIIGMILSCCLYVKLKDPDD